MKPFSARILVTPLALAFVAVEPAASLTLLASALTHGFHGSHPSHSLSVVASEGHLHLVLSHGERGEHDRGERGSDDRTPSLSDRDHVLHIADDDPENALRRPDAPGAVVLAQALPVAATRVFAPTRSAPERPARRSDHLRTVVLRI